MDIFAGVRDFILDILFPRFCAGCGQEGAYLCSDCQSALVFFEHEYCLCQNPSRLPLGIRCRKCAHLPLSGLYSALPYDSPLVKKIISRFKYAPFVKELAKSSADCIPQMPPPTTMTAPTLFCTAFSLFSLLPIIRPLD